jgi:putative ABC transport system substrate-binding protein
VDAFLQGLAEAGYVEGHNLAIVFRLANTQFAQLPALAADLVKREPAVLVVTGGLSAVRAAKVATETIPIVAISAFDLVQYGFVASLNRPGGNLTGFTFMSHELTGKRLGLLHEMVPEATTIGFLIDNNAEQRGYMLEAARSLQREFVILESRSERGLENAFKTLVDRKGQALVVGDVALFANNVGKIATLAELYKIPTMYPNSGYVRNGGLMSYHADLAAGYRQAGGYVARILKGAKPADLPVQRPTKFELVINLKTATALGLKVPATLLATADRVIE